VTGLRFKTIFGLPCQLVPVIAPVADIALIPKVKDIAIA